MTFKKINIRPSTSVYATYKNIKYDPWTAMAEFVDNSTQSYYDNRERLRASKYWDGLHVDITDTSSDKENGKIVIRDNAYGMCFRDFERAIVLDSPPKKATRSEFGMGLKTAACWFGTKWIVESTELGSGIKYRAEVDVEHLHKYRNEDIDVEEIPCSKKDHGTTITIMNLNRTIIGRQIGKTKAQLRGMYRVDLRSGDIKITYKGEPLIYNEPAVLREKLPDGEYYTWKKDISFDFVSDGKTYHVDGCVGVLEIGSTSGAGFTLIRRGRVIRGGYENCYRPEEIFEKSNSYVYQRLFGEINLDDWPVTQTKDDFDWYSSSLEEDFINALKLQCLDYCKKAREYRKRQPVEDFGQSIDNAIQELDNALVIKTTNIEEITTEKEDDEIVTDSSCTEEMIITPREDREEEVARRISFTYKEMDYVVNYALQSRGVDDKWLIVQRDGDMYNVILNVSHPFFGAYLDNKTFLNDIALFGMAMVLAELDANNTARDGLVDPSKIRTLMNDTLKAIVQAREN